MDDYEVVAEELSNCADKWRDLEQRVAEVERVNAQPEPSPTRPVLWERVSHHWDAVYDLSPRARVEDEISSERDHDAAGNAAASL